MNKVTIQTTTKLVVDTEVTLPEGKSWEDVDAWSVKWGTLRVTWKDGSEDEYELDEIDPVSIGEIKAPDEVSILQDMKEIDTD
ncbi:hypothetical protein [Sulfitobacter sp. R18_1]|uniref:hypothetical protein n=1 Tax=Sulfitobacter sp. R18_1 TaxID=2821104 RepID=UPI001ADAE122|nr:hypothetical protein [Sulfitobacter sp. R18_1]MBO9428158.1 hypothetical protein [Sulfitobacter sp. R18_1]